MGQTNRLRLSYVQRRNKNIHGFSNPNKVDDFFPRSTRRTRIFRQLIILLLEKHTIYCKGNRALTRVFEGKRNYEWFYDKSSAEWSERLFVNILKYGRKSERKEKNLRNTATVSNRPRLNVVVRTKNPWHKTSCTYGSWNFRISEKSPKEITSSVDSLSIRSDDDGQKNNTVRTGGRRPWVGVAAARGPFVLVFFTDVFQTAARERILVGRLFVGPHECSSVCPPARAVLLINKMTPPSRGVVGGPRAGWRSWRGKEKKTAATRARHHYYCRCVMLTAEYDRRCRAHDAEERPVNWIRVWRAHVR